MILTLQPPNVISVVAGASPTVLVTSPVPTVFNIPQSTVIENLTLVSAPVDHTHDVSDLEQSGATTNQLLKWNGSAWVPSTQTTLAHTHETTDLTQSGASTNDILQWTGSGWEPSSPTYAPQIASFITVSAESGLSNERVLTSSDHITIVDVGTTVVPTYEWNISKEIECHSEFMGVVAPWTSDSSGSGAATITYNATVTDADCGGQATLSTGTTSTGRTSVGTPITTGTASTTTYMTSGAFHFETRLRLPVLSTSTQRYWVKFGLLYDHNTKTGPGLYFSYQDNVNSGKWQLECANYDGDTATPIDTGIAPVANTWVRLSWIGNAGTPTATAYINGTAVGTFNTAGNMPFGLTPTFSTQPMGYGVEIKKTVGNTNTLCVVDYLSFSQKVNR